MYIHSSIFSLLALLGLFGFVGSLARSRWMTIAFSVGIAIHLALSIASGIFTIVTVFKEPAQAAIEACLEGTKGDEEAVRVCKTGAGIVKGLIVAIYVVAWLIELCEWAFPIIIFFEGEMGRGRLTEPWMIDAYFIVERYAAQLEDEEMAAMEPVMPQQVNNHYHNNPHMMYTGYPQRFSYSHYAESRRSYGQDAAARKEGGLDNANANAHANGTEANANANDGAYGGVQGTGYGHGYYQQQQQGQQGQRPMTEYAFALPNQAYGVTRGKDASNMA